MERLWAPWRLAYVKADRPDGDTRTAEACVFCVAVGRGDDDSLIVHRGRTAYALLNLYPYTNGHVLVTPYRHVAAPAELTDEEQLELWSLVNHSLAALDTAMAPHGANVGMNLGVDAGAGVAAHLHVHVVPRFRGDTNFMASFAETRVLPQSLSDTWRALRDAWPRAGDETGHPAPIRGSRT